MDVAAGTVLFALGCLAWFMGVLSVIAAKRYERSAERYHLAGDEAWSQAMRVWDSVRNEARKLRELPGDEWRDAD